MKVNPSVIKNLMKTVKVQSHRFPGTNGYTAVASLPDGYILAAAVGRHMSKQSYDPAVSKRTAEEKVLRQAEEELWKIEGMRLQFLIESGKSAFPAKLPYTGAINTPFFKKTE